MTSSDDEDADLKQAIALSLQQSLPTARGSTRNLAIDLASDTGDEDEDLRQAIALSLHDAETVSRSDSVATESVHTSATNVRMVPTPTTVDAPKNGGGPLGFLGLDRSAMERERLARLGKRKRDLSPERSVKQVSQKSTPEPPPAISKTPPEIGGLQYPRGTIKRTFAAKYPRTDDISIDEVLQASSVNIAVISSFMWDSEWLYKKLDPRKVKQVWIMNAKDQDTQQRWIQEMKETRVPNLKIHFPPMDGMIHSMHSKFMLLFGKNKLRVVVPTANMTQTDWGEVANDWQPGVMENSVFLVDLPRRSDGNIGDKHDLTPFGRGLLYFLEQQKVAQNVIDGVLKFNFSQTGHLAFVHSIGRAHKTMTDPPTGLPGLAQAIRDLKLDDVDKIELDYAASSLGAVNDSLLQRIFLAACGETFSDNTEINQVRNKIRIYFPTHETVDKSVGGPGCGGIISLPQKYYNSPSFPKECLRDYDSIRRGMLSHNKLLFARGRKKNGTPFAWVYVGSANISESAWGGQKVLKNGSMGSLNIKNWECGIVMPVAEDKVTSVTPDEGGLPPMSVFEGTVEVPFVVPGSPYGGRQPWFFKPG